MSNRKRRAPEMACTGTKRWAWVVVMTAAAIISGCGAAREKARGRSQLASIAREQAYSGQFGMGARAPAERTGEGVTLAQLADSRPDRYLIKNATLTIEARDARQASTQLVAAVQGAGGYVSNTHEEVDGLGRPRITIEVRIPIRRFDRSMRLIEALGKVLEKKISTEDVTEEFVTRRPSCAT
jgi:hypothetical protein